MKNKDVNELFKYIPYGTTVTITHQNPVFRTLKSGDVGSDVLKIQKDLKKLGFYKGATNGMFSEALKGSVKKFQREYRCHVTGVANRQTINLILEKYEMLIEQEKSEDILLE